MKTDKKKTAQALAPQTFAQWMQLADMMAKSSIVPKEFKDKPGDCLVAMQMGAAVGLNPFQAIQSIAVINSRPCMFGDAVLGIVMASGLCENIDETDDGETATCTVKRKGKPTPVTRSFSMEMAKTAKVWLPGKDNNPGKWVSLSERPGPWQSYKERMRQMRARSWCLRDAFPDVLKGLAIREEVEDYGDPEPGEPKNITPAPDLEARMAELMPREKQPEMVVGLDQGSGVAAVMAGPAPVGTKPAKSEPIRPEPETIEVKAETIPPVQETPPSTEREQPENGSINQQILERNEREAQEPPMGRAKTRFTVGTQVFETNGINRQQMMELFKLYPRVAKKYGQEKAADVLKNEFKLDHRADLTEEQAERYTIRLQEMIEG